MLSASLNKTFPSLIKLTVVLYHMSEMPHNRKLNVLSASLNKKFPSFFNHDHSGPLRYVRRYITVNKNVLSASLNKTFP